MAVSVLFVMAAGLGQASAPMLPDVASFAEEASGWLLDGEGLPPDYRLRLLRMEPAARLQIIVFLRRAGLLTDAPWSLDDILMPAPLPEEARE